MPLHALVISLLCCLFSYSCFGNTGDPPEFQRPVRGAIQPIEDSGKLKVHVSKSTTFCFEKDQKLIVYRDGFPAATLKVTEPGQGQCVAVIESQSEGFEVKDWGDTATLDTTINLVQALHMESDADIGDLAAKHARADIGMGLQRILYYGQPRIDNALRDETTNLPMHAATGCRVSNLIVEFIDEYNRIVREDFAKKEEQPSR